MFKKGMLVSLVLVSLFGVFGCGNTNESEADSLCAVAFAERHGCVIPGKSF